MIPILEVKNLCKYFQTNEGWLHAVDDVSLSINREETLGVVGESGCGKSTLGRLILNLTHPTSGEVIFDGKNVTKMRSSLFKKMRKDMQIIFQDPYSSLNPRMTAYEIIEEPLRIFKICIDKESLKQKVMELMDVVGLDARLTRSYPHELDGGRRQRIGLARALALDPKFIVCDEPVSALDVSIQAQVLNLMKNLQKERGLTYLFISHNISVVKHMSNYICVMYLGKIVEYASRNDLFYTTCHPYTKALLSAVPVPIPSTIKKRTLIKGEIVSPIEPKPGCLFSPRCSFAYDKCRLENPILKEVKKGHLVACHLFN